MISKNNKYRLQELAGLKPLILNEGVEFKSISGRSPQGTLSWFAEEYILNISKQIVNSLDSTISNDGLVLEISQSGTKINGNTFTTHLNILNNNEKTEFMLTVSVNFEQNSNTVASVTLKGTTNHFSMNSKHSLEDIQNLVQEVTSSFLNSYKLVSKT